MFYTVPSRSSVCLSLLMHLRSGLQSSAKDICMVNAFHTELPAKLIDSIGQQHQETWQLMAYNCSGETGQHYSVHYKRSHIC